MQLPHQVSSFLCLLLTNTEHFAYRAQWCQKKIKNKKIFKQDTVINHYAKQIRAIYLFFIKEKLQ